MHQRQKKKNESGVFSIRLTVIAFRNEHVELKSGRAGETQSGVSYMSARARKASDYVPTELPFRGYRLL